MCPVFVREDASVCAIFDGTVGDDASHFCQQNLLSHLDKNKQDDLYAVEPKDHDSMTKASNTIGKLLRSTFLSLDGALLDHCAAKSLHYASSTGVMCMLWGDLLTVAHVGDSKACIARKSGDSLVAEWLTEDHKPNIPSELARIESSGGSLTWLHGNQPYIRGGDFHRRQANGEHPKQLNYSRAFGGKDLKMFGLTAEPDVSHFQIGKDDKLILLGSDGIWDVVDPLTASHFVLECIKQGRNATKELTDWVISEMPNRGVHDNATVIAIYL
jgi:protein phosphatase